MSIILIILLIFISGCLYQIRGGSPFYFNGPIKHSHIIAATAQLFVIIPLVTFFHLNPYLVLAYPVGWFLTIMTGWGDIFGVKTLKMAGLFFLRMCESIALFLPLALLTNQPWYNAIPYTFIFAFTTVVIYYVYNHFGPISDNSSDATFNFAEFNTGMLLAGVAIAEVLYAN